MIAHLQLGGLGVGEWFSSFCGSITVQDVGTISQRYRAITKRLNTDYWNRTSETAHSLYAGSYGRNTAIHGFSDLDMIMELPYDVYVRYNRHLGNGQSALLQAAKSSIQKTYWNTSVRADGQVIQVPFTDGIAFEVMPGFLNNDNASYTFPDANDGVGGGPPTHDLRSMRSAPGIACAITISSWIVMESGRMMSDNSTLGRLQKDASHAE